MRISVEFPIGDDLLSVCIKHDIDARYFDHEWPYLISKLATGMINEVHRRFGISEMTVTRCPRCDNWAQRINSYWFCMRCRWYSQEDPEE